MLATACTVALGTASVPVLAAEASAEDGISAEEATEVETEALAPEAENEISAEEADKSEVAEKIAEPKLNVIVNTPVFDGTQNIVVTLKADYDGECGIYTDAVCTVNGKEVGTLQEDISDKELRLTLNKDHILMKLNNLRDGDELVLGTDHWGVIYKDENGKEQSISFPTVSVTYSIGETENPDGGDNGNNGGGTETPEIENPDNGNGDNGNTEIPNPEKPDNGNGAGGNSEIPENPDGSNGGDTENPDGDNTQKPEEQKPITGQTVKPATTNSNTSPKTADMTTVLPVLGTGITSIGVAVAAIFKKRK